VGTEIQWQMCYANKNDCGVGSNEDPFPWVALGAKKGKYNFEFKIVDSNNLGIDFASTNPITFKNGDPQQQITAPVLTDSKTLTFTDLNTKPDKDNPDPVVLDYQLNFTGNPMVKPIDPIIINGGTQSYTSEKSLIGSSEFWLLLGAVFLASILGTIVGLLVKARG
jgi:hypothetical protein